MRDYDIESDLKQEKFQSIKLVQGDRGNKIKINVYEDGQPVKLTGCSITAKYKRADGEIINDGVIENIHDNSFDAVMDSSITKVAGTLKMLFTIEKDAVKVSAFLLLADVREGIGESSSSDGSAGGGEVTGDLSDYYKKIETYSRKEIDAQFKDIAKQTITTEERNKLTNLENYDDTSVKTNIQNVQQQVNNLVLGAVGDGNNAEVVQARIDYSGNTFPTLKSKNDNVEKLIFEKKSIYNNIVFELGGLQQSGSYDANNRVRSTDFLEINTTFDISINSEWKYSIVIYDSNGTFIEGKPFTSDKTIINEVENNKFKLVIGKNDNTNITPDMVKDVFLIEYYPNKGIFKDLEGITEKINDLNDGLNMSILDTELKCIKTKEGYYQDTKFIDNSNNIVYYYDVKNLKSIKLTTIQTQYKNIYTLLDDEYNVIDYLRVNNTEQLNYNEKVITINNASYIAISKLKTDNVDKKIIYPAPIIKNINLKWYAKKIVWFGTSIPAGGKEGKINPNSYPNLLGKRLGANVINEAIGESSLHCKQVHRISDENPYGFENNWQKCARCLTNTLEETEWVLANYDNTNVFTQSTVSSLTDEDKTFYRGCSYENKLLPHLTSGDVDLFVLDHGHNDMINANKIDDNYVEDSVIMEQYGKTNLYTFEGASNFIIQKILDNNPMNKICFIGEYENQKMDKIWTAQMKVANNWLFPIYKQWEKLGWSQNTIKTTGYWNNATGLWVESGGTEQEITMLRRWVRDNIHPHSDASGKAIKWLLDNMETWFLNNL